MRIDIKKEKNILILTPLVKSIDSSNSISLKAQSLDLINQGNYNIILNLTNIDFIDSNGLGSIISMFKVLSEKGSLSIFGTKSTVKSLFKITKMDRVFQMYNTESEAVQASQDKDSHTNTQQV